MALFSDGSAGALADGMLAPDAAAYHDLIPGHSWRVRRQIVQVRCALVGMRLDEASRSLVRLRRLLGGRDDALLAPYRDVVRVLEVCILTAQDDLAAARDRLIGLISVSDNPLIVALLRYVQWACGDDAAVSMPDTLDYLAAPVGSRAMIRIFSLCVSAGLAFDRLQLGLSANLASEALRVARQRYGNYSPISCLPATLLAQVAYEQGLLEDAETLLRPRLAVIRASGIPECVARATTLLARLSLHRHEDREAFSILRDAAALGRARRWPRLVSIATRECRRAMEIVRRETSPEAENSKLRAKMSALPPHTGAPVRLVVRFPPEQGCTPASSQPRARLTAPPVAPLSSDHVPSFSTVESALKSLASRLSHGSSDDAHDLLAAWLRLGATHGLRMVFLDTGRPLLELLETCYHSFRTADARRCELRPYIATLLAATTQFNLQEPISAPCRPLSRRETSILQMIAHGLSNKRIAQSLGITPETVKSHAKSIFVKLATRTRAQAVARAEAIGIL